MEDALRDLSPQQLQRLEDFGERKPREWVWWDPKEERQEMRRDHAKLYPTAGVTYVRHIPQSMKKLNRITRLVSIAHTCMHVGERALGLRSVSVISLR